MGCDPRSRYLPAVAPPNLSGAMMYRLIALLTLLTAAAHAGDLRIGRATEQGSLDPLYSDLGSDVATADNMFESMIRFDSKLRIHASLATEWKLVDALTWEIKLRP